MGVERTGDGGTRRRRDAAATRADILDAAKRAFTRQGYDQIGVREIAADAGVDPALVIRYFGSKDGLFAEAVGQKFDLSPLFTGDRSAIGERLARSTLAKKPYADGFDPMLALLRSAPSEEPGRLLRAAIDDGFVRPLAAVIGGEQAEIRAAMVASVLLGLLVGRSVIKTDALVRAGDEELVAVVAPVLQRIINGD